MILISNVFAFYSSKKELNETKADAIKQAKQDSVQIAYLTQLADINIKKTDAVKTQLIDNAVKAMEEQRKAIEFEKENIFTHLQEEVKENIFVILVNYDEVDVRENLKLNRFTTSRLNTTYLNKYASISSNRNIIQHYIETCNFIDKVNYSANELGLMQKQNEQLYINVV